MTGHLLIGCLRAAFVIGALMLLLITGVLIAAGRLAALTTPLLAYSVQAGVMLVDVPRGAQRVIAPGGSVPRWSPDGKHLLFSRLTSPTNRAAQYCVVTLEGSRLRCFDSPWREQIYDDHMFANWQLDSEHIALLNGMVRHRSDGSISEEHRQPDGISFVQWSPNGQHILVTQQHPTAVNPPMYTYALYDVTTATVTSLTPPDRYFRMFSNVDWSGDGAFVALSYISATNDRQTHQVLHTASGQLVDIVPSSGHAVAWSPRADQLALLFRGALPSSGGFGIVLNVFTTDGTLILQHEVTGTDNTSTPLWSADGERLLYSALTTPLDRASMLHPYSLYSLDVASGATEVLINLPLNLYPQSLSWSPDERWLALVAQDRFIGRRVLYVMNTDQKYSDPPLLLPPFNFRPDLTWRPQP